MGVLSFSSSSLHIRGKTYIYGLDWFYYIFAKNGSSSSNMQREEENNPIFVFHLRVLQVLCLDFWFTTSVILTIQCVSLDSPSFIIHALKKATELILRELNTVLL